MKILTIACCGLVWLSILFASALAQAEQTVPKEPALSEKFEKNIRDAVARYRDILSGYNKNPNPGAAWFDAPISFDFRAFPAAATDLERRLIDLLSRAFGAAEQFRGSHNVATQQGERLARKGGGEMTPVGKIALLGVRATLGHSYKRWIETNDSLVQEALRRWGIALPQPVPPPYLDTLRLYTNP